MLATINLDINFFKNPKIRYIQKMENGNKYILFWIQLLIIAKSNLKNSKLYNKSLKKFYDEQLLSIETNYDVEFINKSLALFESLFMIEKRLDGISIKNWDKYQSYTDIDNINPQSDVINYNTVIDLFNKICFELPKVKMLNKKRNRIIKKAVTIFGSLKGLEDYFTLISNRPYLLGKNKYGWRADFDWCMAEENIAKILEGKYTTGIKQDISSNESTKNFLRDMYNKFEGAE